MSLDIYIYYKDQLVSHVVASGVNNIVHESFCNDYGKNPFVTAPLSTEEVLDFIADRCFEECNPIKDMYLSYLGLDCYNPLDIVRKTHGVMLEDFTWLRFADEPIYKWEDIKHARA